MDYPNDTFLCTILSICHELYYQSGTVYEFRVGDN